MTRHVVVDGSNLATEGRSMPSLTQLNEAVLAYMAEHPGDLVTVVVDATFGHRIDKKEVAEFDDAVANNELVAPPAGAVGRGDAFVLSIANKVNAVVLSNDSFQEFHAQYEWLFDEGRLVGGKPVPHVGWVFVPRLPVRGPVSRKATRGTKKSADEPARSGRGGRSSAAQKTTRSGKASPEASQPMPVPKSPPPGARRRKQSEAAETTDAGRAAPEAESTAAAPTAGEPVNDLMAFLDFVEKHPVGTTVNAVVDHYSSHGAYVQLGDARGYVPLRYMADPAPRSAKSIMKAGEEIELVVASFNPRRRSIDLAVPSMAEAVGVQLAADAAAEKAPAKKAATGKAAAKKAATGKAAAKKAATGKVPAKKAAPGKAPAKRAPAKKATAPIEAQATEEAQATSAPARRASAKAPAKKAPARKAAATTPEKATTKRASAKKSSTPAEKSPAKKAPANKAPANRAPANRAPANRAPANRAPANRAPANKAPANRAPANKAPANKAPANKAPAKKAGAKKASAEPNPGPTSDT